MARNVARKVIVADDLDELARVLAEAALVRLAARDDEGVLLRRE